MSDVNYFQYLSLKILSRRREVRWLSCDPRQRQNLYLEPDWGGWVRKLHCSQDHNLVFDYINRPVYIPTYIPSYSTCKHTYTQITNYRLDIGSMFQPFDDIPGENLQTLDFLFVKESAKKKKKEVEEANKIIPQM